MADKSIITLNGVDFNLKDAPARSMIAPIEISSTASRAYAVGAKFIYNGVLYEATEAIASGSTITPETNCAEKKVSETAYDVQRIADLMNEIRDSSAFTWTLGRNYNDSGVISQANGMALANRINIIEGTCIINELANTGYEGNSHVLFVHEFDASNTFLRRVSVGLGKKLFLPSDCKNIRIAYGYANATGVTITQEIVDTYFRCKIIQAVVARDTIAYIAGDYQPTETYRAGDYVLYGNKFYKAMCDISTPETFVANKWIRLQIANELQNINNNLVSFCTNDEYTGEYIERKKNQRFIINAQFGTSSTSYRFYLAGNTISASSSGNAPSASVHPTELILKNGHIYELKVKKITGTATGTVYARFHKKGSSSSVGNSYMDVGTDGVAYNRLAYDSTEFPEGVGVAIFVFRTSGNTLNDYTLDIELRDITDKLAIAPIEYEKANANHAAGDVFWFGDTLYKATEAIASGETIVTGSGGNVTKTTIADEIMALRALIS